MTKPKAKNLDRKVQRQVKEFLEASSIHGLAYFANSDYSYVQRLFWIVVTTIMISIGSAWVNTLRAGWEANPTKLVIGMHVSFMN
jgi:hypothetical protein